MHQSISSDTGSDPLREVHLSDFIFHDVIIHELLEGQLPHKTVNLFFI